MKDQLNIESRILCIGEVLWDVLPDKKVPGGAPMNVAYHLQKLGLNVQFVSKIGDDELGDQLKAYLNSLGKDFTFQIDKAHQTSIAEVDTSDPYELKYTFPTCAWDFLELTDDLRALANNSDILVYGSLVSRNRKSYETLLSLIKDETKYKVFDMNLRPPNYTREGIVKFLEEADMVKMNESELDTLREWFYKNQEEEELLRKIWEDFNCKIITVTKGSEGASLLYQDHYYVHPGFEAEVVDTIGAGDAFLAGFLYKLLAKDSPEDILSFACAIGALVVTGEGAHLDYSIDQIYASFL